MGSRCKDGPGLWPALQAAMSLQQLAHSDNQRVHGLRVDPKGAEVIRREAKAGRSKD